MPERSEDELPAPRVAGAAPVDVISLVKAVVGLPVSAKWIELRARPRALRVGGRTVRGNTAH
jgi:hypothetical protein